MNQTVTFTAFLRDQFSSPLNKLAAKSDAAFNRINTDFEKLAISGKLAAKSISQIDERLDLLKRSRSLSIDTTAIKTANKEIKALEAERAKLSGENSTGIGGIGLLKGLGIGVGIAALYKAGQFLTGSVGEFNDSAQTEAQIKAGLLSTKGISGKSLSGLKSQANDLQGKTLYEDDTTLAADQILLTFTKIRGAIYDQAVPAIQDMATKMKIDLSSAALQVGKALNDPILGVTALRREGVQLTEAQEKQIKTFIALGQQEKAQAIILKELNTEFGGSAEAAAKAGTGGFTILGNKVKNLSETIGEKLTTNLGGLSKSLGKVVDKVTDWMEIPMSMKLEDERIKVNALASQIMTANVPAEERNKLYDELKILAPDVVSGLDKENIAYNKLKINLKNYNDEMLRSVMIESQKEKLKPLAESLLDAQTNLAEKQSDINILMAEAAKYSQYGDWITATKNNEKLSIGMKAALIKEKISNETGKNYGKLTSIYNQLTDALTNNKYIGNNSISSLTATVAKIQAKINKQMQLSSEAIKAIGGDPGKLLADGTGSGTGNGEGTGLDDGINNVSGGVGVKNITITVQKMIGVEGNIVTNNIKDIESDIGAAIDKVLLTALNDANRMGGD